MIIPTFLSLDDVAALFGASRQQIQRLFTRGHIPPCDSAGVHLRIPRHRLMEIAVALDRAGWLQKARARQLKKVLSQ